MYAKIFRSPARNRNCLRKTRRSRKVFFSVFIPKYRDFRFDRVFQDRCAIGRTVSSWQCCNCSHFLLTFVKKSTRRTKSLILIHHQLALIINSPILTRKTGQNRSLFLTSGIYEYSPLTCRNVTER